MNQNRNRQGTATASAAVASAKGWPLAALYEKEPGSISRRESWLTSASLLLVRCRTSRRWSRCRTLAHKATQPFEIKLQAHE